MTRRLLLSATFIFLITHLLQAQLTLTGTITDSENRPVDGAAVILQTVDSVHVATTLSNADGIFIVHNRPPQYRLIIQHMLYHTKLVTGQSAEAGIIRLEPKEHKLEAVVIKGERPLIKVDNGRLAYDVATLTEHQTVSNAYEALARLPGISEDGGSLKLAGTEKLTVILNGKPTTMTDEQLKTLLLQTPVKQIEKAEVMYNAPPEYHVWGAAVNLVLRRTTERSLQGEVNTGYTNQYFNSGNIRADLRLSFPKLTWDFRYGTEAARKMEYIDLYSRHTLQDRVYDIRQNEQLRSKSQVHNVHTSLSYIFQPQSYIDVAYTGSYTPKQHNGSLTTGNYQSGRVDKELDTRLHNVSLQYHSPFGLDISGDYTHYTSDNRQSLQTDYQEGDQAGFAMRSGQAIDRYAVYADQKHELSRGWSVGYGLSYRLARDRDYQIYDRVVGGLQTKDLDSDLKEHTAGLYLSANKNYPSGTSLQASVAGEYYHIGAYRKWAVYPQLSWTYTRTPQHIFQLSLGTDKTYPGYWDMQSAVTHLNGYTELWGTQGLRPMTTYNLSGTYILKQKYTFTLFFTQTDHYFTQTAYQATDRLALIYKNTNWNYMRSWGANMVFPFKAGTWLDSRFTLTGMRLRQRCDDFFDIPFDRKKWVLTGALDNTFKVNRNLSFECLANVQTPVLQGTFDVGSLFSLTAGMKWTSANDRFNLSVRCDDLFNTGAPQLKVRFKGQHIDMDPSRYSRAFIINMSYRFGGYQKKKTKEVDISRFGH